jgi:hypothetical protein
MAVESKSLQLPPKRRCAGAEQIDSRTLPLYLWKPALPVQMYKQTVYDVR